jgi:hypothetical protein
MKLFYLSAIVLFLSTATSSDLKIPGYHLKSKSHRGASSYLTKILNQTFKATREGNVAQARKLYCTSCIAELEDKGPDLKQTLIRSARILPNLDDFTRLGYKTKDLTGVVAYRGKSQGSQIPLMFAVFLYEKKKWKFQKLYLTNAYTGKKVVIPSGIVFHKTIPTYTRKSPPPALKKAKAVNFETNTGTTTTTTQLVTTTTMSQTGKITGKYTLTARGYKIEFSVNGVTQKAKGGKIEKGKLKGYLKKGDNSVVISIMKGKEWSEESNYTLEIESSTGARFRKQSKQLGTISKNFPVK